MSDRPISLSEEHDHRLSRMMAGETTLREVRDQEGEATEGVEELLATALEVHKLLATPGPSEAFAAASPARVMNRIRSRRALRTGPRPRPVSPGLLLRPAYALTALMLLVALAFSGVGVASAASDSLPGDPLYGVKRGLEEVRMGLAWSEAGKVRLLSEFAEERLGEAEKALALGRPSDADAALSDFADTLSSQVDLLGSLDLEGEGDVLDEVELEIAHHLEVLARVQTQVPASAAIQHAIERSSHGQAVLESLQTGGKPSDLAPGQQGQPVGESPKPDDEQDGHEKPDKTRTPGPPAKPTHKPTKTPQSK